MLEELNFEQDDGGNSEEDKIELIGGKLQSVLEDAQAYGGVSTNEMERPFSPPFSQLGTKSKLQSGLKASDKNQSGITKNAKFEDSLEGNEVVQEKDEKINVVYDPILKCYYDPKANTYYQVN